MFKMTPQFVTADDFNNYHGIDLKARLRDNSNSSNKVDIFLRKIEERLMAWVDANTFRNVSWETLKSDFKYEDPNRNENLDRQKLAWKQAILVQAYYVFRNSDIGTDSGYDPERGEVISRDKLRQIEICDQAIDFIKVAGLYNHVVTNRPRYTRLW